MSTAISLDPLDQAAQRLGDRPRVALTGTSWSSRSDLAIVDWVEQGRWLGAVGRASGWWIGDWVRYGNARYGDKYGPAAQLTGYDVQSLMNMAYVAGRFDRSRRRERLSFSHHAELAGLPPDDQDLWLDRAEAGGLSVRSLRGELRTTRGRVAARLALAQAREAAGATPAVAPDGPELVCPVCGHRLDSAPPSRLAGKTKSTLT